jgi:hypothetical protein
MKELRLQTKSGIWRVTFAFDHERKAILLLAGNKKGKNESAFYEDLIKQSDLRFRKHLRKSKK